MTRSELLKIIIGRARSHGFDFRRWYTGRLGVPWISAEAAINLLDTQRRYYALLFSHDFASAFWKAGEEITFTVPEQVFQRVKPDGNVVQVTRKSFLRRSSRRTAWRYHLREMALAEEPLRYIRKYLNVEEDLDEETLAAALDDPPPPPRARRRPRPDPAAPLGRSSREKPIARPMPTGLPDFLKRPYKP